MKNKIWIIIAIVLVIGGTIAVTAVSNKNKDKIKQRELENAQRQEEQNTGTLYETPVPTSSVKIGNDDEATAYTGNGTVRDEGLTSKGTLAYNLGNPDTSSAEGIAPISEYDTISGYIASMFENSHGYSVDVKAEFGSGFLAVAFEVPDASASEEENVNGFMTFNDDNAHLKFKTEINEKSSVAEVYSVNGTRFRNEETDQGDVITCRKYTNLLTDCLLNSDPESFRHRIEDETGNDGHTVIELDVNAYPAIVTAIAGSFLDAEPEGMAMEGKIPVRLTLDRWGRIEKAECMESSILIDGNEAVIHSIIMEFTDFDCTDKITDPTKPEPTKEPAGNVTGSSYIKQQGKKSSVEMPAKSKFLPVGEYVKEECIEGEYNRCYGNQIVDLTDKYIGAEIAPDVFLWYIGHEYKEEEGKNILVVHLGMHNATDFNAVISTDSIMSINTGMLTEENQVSIYESAESGESIEIDVEFPNRPGNEIFRELGMFIVTVSTEDSQRPGILNERYVEFLPEGKTGQEDTPVSGMISASEKGKMGEAYISLQDDQDDNSGTQEVVFAIKNTTDRIIRYSTNYAYVYTSDSNGSGTIPLDLVSFEYDGVILPNSTGLTAVSVYRGNGFSDIKALNVPISACDYLLGDTLEFGDTEFRITAGKK